MRLQIADIGTFIITRPIEGHDKAKVEHEGSKLAVEVTGHGSFKENKYKAIEVLKKLLKRRK